MDRGFYNAVAGSIIQTQRLDVISNNLANSNTPGFKQDRIAFEGVLNDRLGNTRPEPSESKIDLSHGSFEMTRRTLDLAIQGEGFFALSDEAGNVTYTRAGNFQLNANAELVAPNGDRVLAGGGAVTLPHTNVTIDGEGRIWDGDAQIGAIDVYQTDRPEELYKVGGNRIAHLRNNGMYTSNNSRILQGMLEGSNVNGVELTTQMIETQRIFEASQNLLKQYGGLAIKANEIGKY